MTDVIINKPTNNYEATVLALVLAITADTDTKVSACIKLAEGFGLSREDMERAKQTALLQLSDRASLFQC